MHFLLGDSILSFESKSLPGDKHRYSQSIVIYLSFFSIINSSSIISLNLNKSKNTNKDLKRKNYLISWKENTSKGKYKKNN